MPAKGTKSKRKPSLQLTDVADASPISFTAKAQELYDKVNSRWKLDHVSHELLTIACQNISQADRCQAVLEREGLSFTSRFDEPRQHPLLKQQQQFLTSASNTLSKLQLSLG